MKGLVVLAVALSFSVNTAWSQPPVSTRITLSGFSGNLGSTILSDHDQGYRESAILTITADIPAVPPLNRVATVYLRGDAAAMTGGKSISTLSWRRSDLAVWNTLTTSNALIDSQNLQGNGAYWTTSIVFRAALDWTTDSPGPQSVDLTFTLVVSAP